MAHPVDMILEAYVLTPSDSIVLQPPEACSSAMILRKWSGEEEFVCTETTFTFVRERWS